MSTQVAALKHEIATLCVLAAEVGGLRRRVADLEHQVAMGERPVDWSHPGKIGAGAPAAAVFTDISYSGQLTSTVAFGTAPLVVTSTTKVLNLNVDLLDGGDWAAPGAIGTGTPAAATFTALTATGNINFGTAGTNSGVNLSGASSGAAGGVFFALKNSATTTLAFGNKSALIGGAYDGTPYVFAVAQVEFHQGIKVPGGAQFIQTSSALTNGAGAGAGTITNAPSAGNPTKWIGINDNGTIRYVPAW
jgi:hypothetical protein